MHNVVKILGLCVILKLVCKYPAWIKGLKPTRARRWTQDKVAISPFSYLLRLFQGKHIGCWPLIEHLREKRFGKNFTSCCIFVRVDWGHKQDGALKEMHITMCFRNFKDIFIISRFMALPQRAKKSKCITFKCHIERQARQSFMCKASVKCRHTLTYLEAACDQLL